jgi:hypothetical protein
VDRVAVRVGEVRAPFAPRLIRRRLQLLGTELEQVPARRIRVVGVDAELEARRAAGDDLPAVQQRLLG